MNTLDRIILAFMYFYMLAMFSLSFFIWFSWQLVQIAYQKLRAIAIALFAGLVVCGCTATTGQVYAGYEQAAKAGVQIADDNAIKTINDQICAIPYGAIIRNTSFIPVAKAACLPSGSNSAPDTLLPTVTPITSAK